MTLGSGSTARYFVEALGRQHAEGLPISCVATSSEPPGMTGNVNVQLDLSVQIRFRESGPWGERPIATVLAEGIDSSREVIRQLAPYVTWTAGQ